jgi:hypothetical protein
MMAGAPGEAHQNAISSLNAVVGNSGAVFQSGGSVVIFTEIQDKKFTNPLGGAWVWRRQDDNNDNAGVKSGDRPVRKQLEESTLARPG